MNCHVAERQIFAERDGALDQSQRAALAAHVAGCAACRVTRERLAAAIESWRVSTQAVVTPDPDREWQSLRRQIRGGVDPSGREPARRRVIPWLAVPLGAAAAIALAFFVASPGSAPTTRNIARADSVEVSAADGSVVYVDDTSGWVVIWEGEPVANAI